MDAPYSAVLAGDSELAQGEAEGQYSSPRVNTAIRS